MWWGSPSSHLPRDHRRVIYTVDSSHSGHARLPRADCLGQACPARRNIGSSLSELIQKTIICLANSRKPPSGRCIPGREIVGDQFGDWIRPVSDRPTDEISEEERRYQDGSDPRLLDVITIVMAEPRPHQQQRENHVIDSDYYWSRVGSKEWQDLAGAIEDPAGPLWLNGSSSTFGVNDRVAETALGGIARSLYLVRPDRLVLSVAPEQSDFTGRRRRVRAKCDLSGHSYWLSVTDPSIEARYLAGPDGDTELNNGPSGPGPASGPKALGPS